MNLFPVYTLFDIEPVRGQGSWVWDAQGNKYLDFYGGHAVISIGHSHPVYVRRIQEQVEKLGFYSNSVQNSLQEELAEKLGQLSGYEDYQLFLVNSGAEAIENALKLASFHTQRKRVLVLERAFHGRTSAAVAITHNPKIQAPINFAAHVTHLPFNDESALEAAFEAEPVCAVVVEGMQGVGGIHVPQDSYWHKLRALCDAHGAVLIADEIQSGYGRSGKFFAHQHAGVQADLITVAKGMGNGFPIGGVLVSPSFEAWPGMLGTTFGGNHLACAAGLAVLDTIESEKLMENARQEGAYLIEKLAARVGEENVRGKGLMIGIELPAPAGPLRKKLLFEHHIFTGSSSQPHVLRLLPPLSLNRSEADHFLEAFFQLAE
jgi:acetylornithine/N-succinyldiaminopimelate aminotransferase